MKVLFHFLDTNRTCLSKQPQVRVGRSDGRWGAPTKEGDHTIRKGKGNLLRILCLKL